MPFYLRVGVACCVSTHLACRSAGRRNGLKTQHRDNPGYKIVELSGGAEADQDLTEVEIAVGEASTLLAGLRSV
jgi:hypothetical protein